MQDGALMGARFDAAIDPDTDHYMTNGLGIPVLSANDPDTAANELRTQLVVNFTAATGDGRFSMGDLLGSGMASDEGERFIDTAVKNIEKVKADVDALLALDTKPTGLETILDGQWNKLKAALDPIFGTDSDAETGATTAVRASTPREEDIQDDIDDVLDALSSEASFVAATADGGGGVFESQALGAGAAANAFNRLTWSAEATLGVTGSTRYGTAARKTSANAKKAPALGGDYGAFAYSTMQQTVRTADAAAVSLTGIASYSGGTRAVSGTGKAYSGQMDLQVRFKANSVSGVVSGLEDSDGLPWQHNFADVDRIVLDDATLRRNAQWTNSGTNASVFYTADSGLLRPVAGVTNSFAGILLGQGAEAGSEANGTWSVGTSGSGYLTGGFGVQHVADTARPVPTQDDGSVKAASLFSMATDTNAAANMTTASIADGVLTVKQRSYGWAGRSGDTDPTYQALGADGDETLLTAKFDLATMAGQAAGTATTINGPKWADQVIEALTTERDLLATLQGLDSDDTQVAERAAWQRVQDAVEFQLLGQLPLKLAQPYDDPDGNVDNELESEADAIDLINRALDALSSAANLQAALDPDGTGVFDHYADSDDAGDDPDNFGGDVGGVFKVDPGVTATVDGDTVQSFAGGRTTAQILGERTHKVIATLGTTSFTRFGAWRRESVRNAVRGRGTGGRVIRTLHGGPGTFAYSPLDPTNVGTPTNPGFPRNGRASYTGETVAIQNTTILTGTVRVDVNWNSLADTTNGLNADGSAIAQAGTMSLTISDLASTVGDPLTVGGAADVGNTPDTFEGTPGTEIADIVLGTFNILAGAPGNNSGHMVVGTASTDDPANVTYREIASTASRLRFAGLSTPDNTTAVTTSGVKALFVGQGVDGPLGVIGTWTVQGATIGRLSADGRQTADLNQAIRGAFGAEAP